MWPACYGIGIGRLRNPVSPLRVWARFVSVGSYWLLWFGSPSVSRLRSWLRSTPTHHVDFLYLQWFHRDQQQFAKFQFSWIWSIINKGTIFSWKLALFGFVFHRFTCQIWKNKSLKSSIVINRFSLYNFILKNKKILSSTL